MKKINWGIIGTGTIAKKFATTINNLKDSCQLYAVGSRNVDSASSFAAEFSIPNYYDRYEQLAADKNIDIVYIATPHTFHFNNMLLCIKNGRNILCEKPFTVNAKEAQIIFEAAKENNVFVMEAFWTRFLPAYKKINEVIDSGKLGDLVSLTVQYGYTVNDVARKKRKLNSNLAGGALLDIGIYTVGVAAMLMKSEPVTITSELCLDKEYNTDYLNAITMKYENGVIAQLSSCIGANLLNEALLFCKNGCIRIPRFASAQDFTVELNDGTKENYKCPFEINGFEYQVNEAINCINNKKIESNVMKHSDTLSVMSVLDTIRRQNNFIYPFEQII